MRLIPRDEGFYELFIQLAQRVTNSADLLNQLFNDPSQQLRFVAAMKEEEHQADGLTHEIIDRINRSFVTPFDREDIHELASEMDEVVDLLDGTARRVEIFQIAEGRPEMIVLTGVMLRAARELEAAVRGMKDVKVVNAKSRELKKLEEEGDAIYHQAMGALFASTRDALEVLKWKELYDKVEDALDQCEDVANVLQSIALKNG